MSGPLVRGAATALLVAALFAPVAGAQAPSTGATTNDNGAATVPPPQPGARQGWATLPDSVRRTLQRLQAAGELGPIGAIDSVILGSTRVASGDTVRGSLVVYGGTLTLDGVVDGSAAVVRGDLLIGPGGVVTGSASAAGGAVRVAGGQVGGETRSASTVLSDVAAALSGAFRGTDAPAPALSPAETTWRNARLTFGFFAMFVVLGVGLLVFSQPTLDSVVRALQDRFGRAFWTGLLAQFAILPLLLLLCTALAISVIGILLIPFAVVAYVIAVAGLFALGFLAAARLTGGVFGAGDLAARNANLRGLVAGLLIYFALWLVAAGLSWHPFAGTLARAVALAVTWVAVTVGLGGIIAAGLAARRARAEALSSRSYSDMAAWQTPTPITGVVAARRPVPSRKEA